MSDIKELSITAQVILAGHWGLSPSMELTMQNQKSRLTKQAADAMTELIYAGLVKAEKANDSCAESMTYTLTEKGKALRFRKSIEWVEKHGNFKLTEQIVRKGDIAAAREEGRRQGLEELADLVEEVGRLPGRYELAETIRRRALKEKQP